MRISRIALKFSALVSLVILTVMSVMAGLVFRQTERALQSEMEVRAEFFARSAREAIFPTTDLFALSFAASELAREKAIVYALVQDPAGKVLAHNDLSRAGRVDDSPVARSGLETPALRVERYRTGGGELYDIAVPVQVRGRRVGTARLGYSHDSVTQALAPVKREIRRLTIVILAGGVLVTVLVVTFMLRPIHRLADAAQQVRTGNLDVQVRIRRRDELGDLATRFNEMIAGLKERDFIRETFGRYVSPEVAKTILAGKVRLGGERREATILMTDLRDFTKMAEALPPEQVVEILNDYLKVMVDVIIKYEGTLDKFIGDAILAVFGAPLQRPDDPQRAVAAAWEMRAQMGALNRRAAAAGLPQLRMGIALNTGPVVAGNIGSEKRMEYTVIGDTVNLTARIEALNKEFGTDILLNQTTYDCVKDVVGVMAMAPVKVKGKAEDVQVYQLLRLRGAVVSRWL